VPTGPQGRRNQQQITVNK